MRLTNRDVRVSDAERRTAAEMLGDHWRSGRLSLTEYDERVGHAYAARTYGDLRALFADLPRPLAVSAGPVADDLRLAARRLLTLVQMGLLAVLVLTVALVVLLVHAPGWIVLLPVALLALRWWRRPSRRLAGRRTL